MASDEHFKRVMLKIADISQVLETLYDKNIIEKYIETINKIASNTISDLDIKFSQIRDPVIRNIAFTLFCLALSINKSIKKAIIDLNYVDIVIVIDQLQHVLVDNRNILNLKLVLSHRDKNFYLFVSSILRYNSSIKILDISNTVIHVTNATEYMLYTLDEASPFCITNTPIDEHPMELHYEWYQQNLDKWDHR